MKIDRKQKLLFIHIPKCGGTSIFGSFKMSTWIENSHAKASIVKNECPKMWKKFLKFCVVRNPWEAEVSSFFYKISIKEAREGKDHLCAVLRGFPTSLRKAGVKAYPINKNSKFPDSMMRYITDDNDEIIVDEILRLENIESDLKSMCKKHNLKYPKKLHHWNQTSHLHYSHYYTEQWMIDYVHEKNKDYIDYFKYEFEPEFC